MYKIFFISLGLFKRKTDMNFVHCISFIYSLNGIVGVNKIIIKKL